METVLSRLMAAAQDIKKGIRRVYEHVKDTLEDCIFEIFAPLAADCLIWKLDLSYRTDRVGSGSNEADYDNCTQRLAADDCVTIGRRL
eukprot:4651646-Prymnesium_polylepis.1